MIALNLIIIVNLFTTTLSIPLRIGGLFEGQDQNEELTFKLAIEILNEKNPFYVLEPIYHRVSYFNTLAASEVVCSMLQIGIVGIIGPASPYTSPQVQSLCDIKNVPLLEIHWDLTQKNNNYSVNLYPYPTDLARAFLDLVKACGWRSFTILYENNDGLFRIAELLRMYNSTQHTITLRQLKSNGDHRSLLMATKKAGERYYVIDCSLAYIEEILEQAEQVGILTEDYHYILLNLDAFTLDMSRYQYGGANITGVRLVNHHHVEAENLLRRLQKVNEENGIFDNVAAYKLKTQTALMIDALDLLHRTLIELQISSKFDVEPLYCTNTEGWSKGLSIMNYMKMKSFEGITGVVKFDTVTGVRNHFSMDILELSLLGVTKIGQWSSVDGFNISRSYHIDPHANNDENQLRKKTFKVITALTPPYGMLKNVSFTLTGNDRFEGYGIDLFEELSRMLEFNYTLIIQEDGANGNYNFTTKHWDGMIGEIIAGRADFAIADLTISSDRERHVDFTMPFMSLGISILYRKPEPEPPSLFTFASPFAVEVWALLLITYLLVSLSFFVCGRLCPTEWTNPFPCVTEPKFLVNQYSFRNAIWYTTGSLMQQGSEIAPIGISTRMAAGVWYFFTLIFVSSYTANLAAFLSIEDLITPFNDVEGLVSQKTIKYGAKANGATSKFFQDSNYSVYPEIRSYMNNHTELMTGINEEGVEKAENENYAFFMESTTIEYMVERHCNLTQVGGALDEKGYGIAMKKNSEYRYILTDAILKLQESGVLEELKRKWWKEKRGGGTCEKRQPSATPLDLQNLGGVFFVLGVGTLCGTLFTLIELSCHTYKISRKTRTSFRKGLKRELNFVAAFEGTTRDTNKDNITKILIK